MNRHALTIAALAALAAIGCHKKPPAKVTAATSPVAEATPAANANGDEARAGLPDVKTQSLATIYFDFDSATLTDSSKEIIQKNFEILRDHPEVTVRLEGNSDERGGTQYNVALGERRAQSVKTFLTSLGIPPNRLETVSYGEEKPVDPGHDEAAWAKNRRVELTVTAGNDKVSSSR